MLNRRFLGPLFAFTFNTPLEMPVADVAGAEHRGAAFNTPLEMPLFLQ